MTYDPRGPDPERPHISFRGGFWFFRWAKRRTRSPVSKMTIAARNAFAADYVSHQEISNAIKNR